MKCPLLEAGVNANIGNLNGDEGECLKDKCGWWNTFTMSCSVLALSKIFLALGNTLGITSDRLIRPMTSYTCGYCRLRVSQHYIINGAPPVNWTRQERADGKLSWLCNDCSAAIK